MAHDDTALRTAVELVAWTIAAAGTGLLLLSCAAEIVRRVRGTSPLVTLADRLLPTASRRVAVVMVTLASAAVSFLVPAGARADDDLRSWLTNHPSATATTSTTSLPSSPPPKTPSTVPTTISPAPAVPMPDAATTRRTPTAPRAAVVIRPSTTPVADPSAGAPVTVPAAIPAPVEVPPPIAISAPDATPPAPTPAASGAPTHTVVVGECLWKIAADALGRGATPSAVDRGWRAIYAANRDAIGADPNLIHPGLELVLPSLHPTP